jgi:hypothetical protein
MQLNIAAKDPGMMSGRGLQCAEAPRKDLNDPAALLVERHALDVLKQRGHLAVAIRQGDPELHAAHAAAVLGRLKNDAGKSRSDTVAERDCVRLIALRWFCARVPSNRRQENSRCALKI